MGQFLSDYLAENGRRIPILGQISVNISVELLGIPHFRRTSGPIYTENLMASYDTTGWGDGVTSNHKWLVQPGGPYSNVSMAWGNTIPACSAYMPRIPENPRASMCRVRDDFRCVRFRELDHRRSRSCNHIANPRVNWCGDDHEGLVDQ